MDPYRSSSEPDAASRSLLHRWFVKYNPMYLASAALVLAGVIMTSRGLVREGSAYGPLVVALIAEIYACALVFGAALLTRIGQRRPAVLLALITIVYQGDLTLHTETCAYLGGIGIAASIAWLSFFVGKLYALAWALQIRLAWRAVATASLGAFSLALGPHLTQTLSARASGAALAVAVLAVGVTFPRAHDEAATSLVELDAWGATVLRRCVRAAWTIWALLSALHVLFWFSHGPLALDLVLPALVCVAVARMHDGARAAAIASGLLALVLLLEPDRFSWTALLLALALASRALASRPIVLRARAVGCAVASFAMSAWSRPYGAHVAEHVPRPRTMLEWGVTALSMGFLLLVIGLVTSFLLRQRKREQPLC